MSLSLFPQQYPACLVHRTWMVLEVGGRQLYRCCFVGCGFQDLFITTHSILVQLSSSFFSIRFVSVHVVHPYSSMDTTADGKNCVLFYQTSLTSTFNSPLIAVHTFTSHVLMSFLVDETNSDEFDMSQQIFTKMFQDMTINSNW